MSAKFAPVATVVAVVLAVLLFVIFKLPGCRKGAREEVPVPTPTPSVTPRPTVTPKPTPIYIPQKRLETSKLFNDMQVKTRVESEPGDTATIERLTPGSYAVEINVKVKVPKANTDLASLSKLNPDLPKLLPGLPGLLEKGRVSEKYEALYGRKLAMLQRNLPRLDSLLSRHNFYDCETILELRHPQTKRTAVLIQADMDVDTDGSDPDRLPAVDASDPTFQPMTSYRWPKQTELVNPFLAGRQARLHALEAELAKAKGLGEPRLQALRESIGAARYEVSQLKNYSFLLAATDPYVVLPGMMQEGQAPAFRPGFQPKLGDYCAVIHGNIIYPAIVGDIGPKATLGEASLRIGKEINSEASGLHRPESQLKVTYLFFPNSADEPAGPPDLDKWHARVEALLNEIGGYGGSLHKWVNLSRPAPTPTPTPTPSPSAAPGASPGPGTPCPTVTPCPTLPVCPPGTSPSPAVPAPPAAPAAASATPPVAATPTPSPSATPSPKLSPKPSPKEKSASKPASAALQGSPKPAGTPAASPRKSP